MGKRKERRLAALGNTGRRVKLDLFVEPSGDLCGSSTNHEDGGRLDSKREAGLPNSPSSSGRQNPLQLLGQYSDDDLDQESNETVNHATEENSPSGDNDQVTGKLTEGCENMYSNASEEFEKVKQEGMENGSTLLEASDNLGASDTRETDVTASDNLLNGIEPAGEISNTGTSDVQVVGDVSSGWKLVMHEESNQYYYWNTETGETSWEVPSVFSGTSEPAVFDGTSELTYDRKDTCMDGKGSTPGGMLEFVQPDEVGASTAALTTDASMNIGLSPQIDGQIDGYKSEVAKTETWDTKVNGSVISNSVDVPSANEHKTEHHLPYRLVKQSGCLLDRLKSLIGSEGPLQSNNWVSKYTAELEIRLCDMKALLPYGSSLLPFWMHSERQLKRLESLIDEFSRPLQVDDVKTIDTHSVSEKDNSNVRIGHIFEVDANEIAGLSSGAQVSHVSNVRNDTAYGSPQIQADFVEVSEMVTGPSVPTLSPTPHVGEDVDMDVDMEVEDAIPTGRIGIPDGACYINIVPSEHQSQSTASGEYTYFGSAEGFSIPPPPDEEWVPPLPPDNEQVPPPPPDNEQVPLPPSDEPPESLFPSLPTYTGAMQPLPYTQHYNLSYPNSNFEYYKSSLSDLPSNNLYGNADGCQVTVPHGPLYYNGLPNTYSETAPVISNHVQVVAYYELQNGSVPPVNVDSSAKSSVYSDPVSYDTAAEARPDVGIDDIGGTNIASSGIPTSAMIQASATISAKETVVSSSNNSVSAASKPQSKVLRTKKRTVSVAPSLKSNKKVSSLVDKWRAAKDELHEDEEDEPENAYEILEKKRQREIEKWRAQQIASGEAKDNANFQPLGGDWRERIKRRRAQKASEAVPSSPEVPAAVEKPDFVELSKNLPSGWQVYWDESSNKAYYGNTVTSETTWTRPTK